MKRNDLHETLIAIGRSPEVFYRDTPMLFKLLDDYKLFDRRLKNVGRVPERRNVKKEL